MQYDTGILVAGEPSRAARWFPVNGHPLDKATYSFIITVVDPYVVVANGLFQEVIENDDVTLTYIWEASDPMASYLVTLGISDFERREQQGPDGLLIRNYFPSDLADEGEFIYSDQAEMMALFNELFSPYPFEAYGALVADTELSFALETQTISLFGRNTITNSNRPEDIEVLVAHELAHQWFGDSVSVYHWRDIWLNESFATYASWLWLEDQYGRNTLDAQVRNTYESLTLTEEEALDNIFGNIPAMSLENLANGIRTNGNVQEFDFVTGEILDLFMILAESNIQLSPENVQDVLIALAGDRITSMQYDAIMADVPADGFTMGELVEWLSSERDEFAEFSLTATSVDDMFEALGDQSLVLDAELTQAVWIYIVEYGLFDGTIPGLVILPPGDPPPDNLLHSGVYVRGAVALHALRLEVGDDAFFEILNTYTERFRYGNASTGDFINVSEAVSGQDLFDFFMAWLYDALPPDIPQMNLSVD